MRHKLCATRTFITEFDIEVPDGSDLKTAAFEYVKYIPLDCYEEIDLDIEEI
jgi:hypothetical protein